MPLENQQHEAFVRALVKGMSQGDAYKAAGYKAKTDASAAAAASRLLKDVKIQARLQELLSAATEKAVLTKSWVIEKLMENVHRAMQAVPVLDREGNETGEYTYNGSVANRALELLGKEQGMFIDRKEIGKPGDFSNLTNTELDEMIDALQKATEESKGATQH